ncbi:hypothetical protein ACFSTA_00290 [Ornithinibacillus salinisoli]|uniref:Lipoprotein n=1 Tax=Ornithinibacillus salinisoli TaxID=1848459 RepID=A0ABW4VW12_9BACI
MKKKCTVLISFIIMLGVIVGCSAKAESFDDENIIFKLADTEPTAKAIEITNKTGFDLVNLTLKISYPVNKNNKTETETIKSIEEFKIVSGETKEISIQLAPNEGIEATDLEVDLQGNVVKRNEKVPFKIGGALSALVSRP